MVVCAAFALLLGRLIIAGLVATTGFLITLITSVLFLIFWVIPGGLRSIGIRALTYTIGLQLQALFITTVLAAIMIISVTFALLIPKYGILAIAALNIALFLAAARTQAWLD